MFAPATPAPASGAADPSSAPETGADTFPHRRARPPRLDEPITDDELRAYFDQLEGVPFPGVDLTARLVELAQANRDAMRRQALALERIAFVLENGVIVVNRGGGAR